MSEVARMDVFLTHNSQDKAAIRELKQRLEARGLTVWLDEEQLPPGQRDLPLIQKALRSCRAVAVCVGAAGPGPWQQEEVEEALRAVKKDGRPLIPVVLPHSPEEVEFPAFVSNRTWISFRLGWSDEEQERLIWGITGRRPGPSSSRPHNLPRLPFFFGRED